MTTRACAHYGSHNSQLILPQFAIDSYNSIDKLHLCAWLPEVVCHLGLCTAGGREKLTPDRTIIHNAAVMVMDSSALPDTGWTFTNTARTTDSLSHLARHLSSLLAHANRHD